uniref:Aldose reductase, putative n=1 Tax=Entamoeba invadens TaxID=33085 RepID=S0B0L1_ENTIV|nr:aldose reductase, putative [Entamoeba invadens]
MQHGFILNNGYFMPAIGLGTWLAKPGEVGAAVQLSLEQNYRMIDCARFYKNEKEIGEVGIGPYLQTHKRTDIFVTSKLWIDQVNRVRESCLESIQDLKCKYLDLYLMHWPVAVKENSSFPPKTEDFIEKDICDTWKDMEKLVDEGLVKSIGISNFNERQIEKIMKVCRIKPVVNQIEMNVYMQQKALRKVCDKYEIVVEAYRPIGGMSKDGVKSCLDDEVVVQLAQKYSKSTAQICLKFLGQSNVISVPKSTNANRLKQNVDLFDWKIEEEDMKQLGDRDLKKRDVMFKECWNGKTYGEFWGEKQ